MCGGSTGVWYQKLSVWSVWLLCQFGRWEVCPRRCCHWFTFSLADGFISVFLSPSDWKGFRAPLSDCLSVVDKLTFPVLFVGQTERRQKQHSSYQCQIAQIFSCLLACFVSRYYMCSAELNMKESGWLEWEWLVGGWEIGLGEYVREWEREHRGKNGGHRMCVCLCVCFGNA